MGIVEIGNKLHQALNTTRVAEGVAPLLIRLYLAPVLIQAGWNKALSFDSVVQWFGSGLGMPFPELMAFLAIGAELVGGVLILIGLATRWASIPLMVTMVVAAVTVHWQNGWPAIADASSWLADGTILYNEQVTNAPEKLAMAKDILQEYGNYDWLTGSGSFVILNNGIEFAATYFIMLLSLFFTGGGRFTSLDYFICRSVCRARAS